MTTVSDILRRKDTRIITVRLRETAATAAMIMKREKIGALVVKDVCRSEGSNVTVGVLSERDLAQAVARYGSAAMNKPVAELLPSAFVSCSEHDSIEAVMRLMLEGELRVVPVMQEHTLIGVVTMRDLIPFLLPNAETASPELAQPAART